MKEVSSKALDVCPRAFTSVPFFLCSLQGFGKGSAAQASAV